MRAGQVKRVALAAALLALAAPAGSLAMTGTGAAPLDPSIVKEVRTTLAAEPYIRELHVPSVSVSGNGEALCGLVDARRRGAPLRFIYVRQAPGKPRVEIDDRSIAFEKTWQAFGCTLKVLDGAPTR